MFDLWTNSTVSFRNPRKTSSYLVRAKLYPLDRVVGTMKCGKKRCEICMNVSEANKITSNLTGKTYKINHKLTCDVNCLIYLLSCNCCGKQYVRKQLTALGINGIAIRIMTESIIVSRAESKNICINILTAWDKMVSLGMFQ